MARAKTPAAAGGLRRFGPLAKLVTASLVIAMFVVAFELFLRIPGLVTGMPYYAYDVGTGPRVAPNRVGATCAASGSAGGTAKRAGMESPGGLRRRQATGDDADRDGRRLAGRGAAGRRERDHVLAGAAVDERRGAAHQWYAFGVAGYGPPRSSRSSAITR